MVYSKYCSYCGSANTLPYHGGCRVKCVNCYKTTCAHILNPEEVPEKYRTLVCRKCGSRNVKLFDGFRETCYDCGCHKPSPFKYA